MAKSTLALGSSLNLKRINNSVSGLSNSVRKAQSSAANISKSLLDSNRNKRKSLALSSSLFRRRREASLRKEREDILEAGSVVGAIRRTGKVAMSSTKGFLGRILDYVGSVLVGWAIINLPKIINMAQDLIGRMQKYFGILQNFVSGIFNSITGLVQRVGESITSLTGFRFDNIKGLFDDALNKMKTAFARIETGAARVIRRIAAIDSIQSLLNYFNIKDFPLLDKILKDEREDTDSAPSEDAKSGSGGTKYPKLAALISSGEGGLNSVNRGNAGDTPGGAKSIFGKNLTEMTVGEILQAQSQEKVFAVGMYQFIPATLRGAVNYTKIPLNTLFDAKTQNKLFDYLIDVKRPEIGAYINGKSNDRRTALQQLAREFAAVGLEYAEAGRVRGQSRYAGIGQNAASISPDRAGDTLDSMRSSRQTNKVQTTGLADDPSTITYPDGTKQIFKPGTEINFEPFRKGRETVYNSANIADAGSDNIIILKTTETVYKKIPMVASNGYKFTSRPLNNTMEAFSQSSLVNI